MIRRVKLAPNFLNIKLMPMLLLIQWVGLIGGISVLHATRGWAVMKTATSSSTVSEELADQPTDVSTKAKDLSIATASKSADLSITTTQKSTNLSTTASEPNAVTKIIAQATSDTPSTPATTSQPDSSITSEPEVTHRSSTSTFAPTKKPVTSRKSSTTYSSDYVDPTDYSIGATQPKRKSAADRPSVVFSERSTGCQAILSAGQGVASNLCSRTNQASKRAIANTKLTRSPSAMSTKSLKLGMLPSSGITSTRGNSTKASLSRSATGSVSISQVPRSGSPGAVWGNFASSFRNSSSIKVAKWFVPSNTRIIFPLAIPTAITSAFGWRLHPITGTWRFHSGTDLGAPMGTPVLAAYPGKVAIADFLGGYGLAVVLDHNKGTQESLYGHLSEITVKPGAQVEQGDVIGLVGSTGNSTGPHLHFEVRQSTPQGWVAVDPGQRLEVALAQLVRALQTAQASSSRTGT